MWQIKKEIYVGTNLEVYGKIVDILKANRIAYKTKVVANDGAEFSIFSFMFRSSRRARGSYGENPDYMKTYYIYVNATDYEQAIFLINRPSE